MHASDFSRTWKGTRRSMTHSINFSEYLVSVSLHMNPPVKKRSVTLPCDRPFIPHKFHREGFSTTNKSGKLNFTGIEELRLMSRLLPRSLFFTNKRNNGTHIPQPYEVCVIDRRNSPVIIVDAQHLIFNDVQFAVAKLEGYVHNDW